MTTAARVREQRYATHVEPHPLQDLAGFWLGHALEETQLAQRLVAAGLEEPAKAHAEAAASCAQHAIKALSRADGALKRISDALAAYRLEAGPRSAHSESMLR
jgi:hypothetical protein